MSDPDPTTLLNPDRHHNFTSCYQINISGITSMKMLRENFEGLANNLPEQKLKRRRVRTGSGPYSC